MFMIISFIIYNRSRVAYLVQGLHIYPMITKVMFVFKFNAES